VQVELGGRPVTGRVTGTDDAGVTLDLDGTPRHADWAEMGRGKVQVEFNRPGEGRAAGDGVDGED